MPTSTPARKYVVAVIILLILFLGFITNSKNVRTEPGYYESITDYYGAVAPKLDHAHHAENEHTSRVTSINDGSGINYSANDDCFKARNAVPVSSYHTLPKPYINLGFPKMGTSSLHAFFKCGGLTSTHFRCGRNFKCALCAKQSVDAGLPPLAQCGAPADVYAQMDDAVYFPQIELLEEFVHGYPNVTFFLTFRSMEKWYHSISHWPPRKNGPFMRDRMMKFNITGSPTREGEGSLEDFSDWYCNHVKRVRNIVAQNPSHSLVEVDIEDPETGEHMEDMFGIDKECWGQTNVNINIHPDLDKSEVAVSRAIKKNDDDDDSDLESADQDEISDDKNDDEINDEKNDNDDDSADNKDDDTDGDEDDADAAEDLESYTKRQIIRMKRRKKRETNKRAKKGSPLLPSDVTEDKIFFNRTCFRAKNDSVSPSLYHKLPKPYINLGFPKMGTSSIHAFFECGGLKSTHYRCGRDSLKCALCTQQSVEAGLPPLAQCGKADVYAQIDNGVYFPQVELLEEFVHGHPNATFFLTFRSMEKWFHSISHWPPRKNGPFMRDRLMKNNITGSPTRDMAGSLKEFSDWYCNHVTRVRDLVAKHPSHTLVEVDIEDPEIGQRMEDMFGIEKSCWGQTNVNANIHPEVNQSEVVLSKAQQRQKRREEEEAAIEDEDEEKSKRRRARERSRQ